MAKQPKSGMKSQLKELQWTQMLESMFPNLNTLAAITLSIPVSTASIERFFFLNEANKDEVHSSPSDSSLSKLMK